MAKQKAGIRVKYFLKRNLFYILWIAALAAVVTATILVFRAVSKNNVDNLNNSTPAEQIDNSITSIPDVADNDGNETGDKSSEKENDGDKNDNADKDDNSGGEGGNTTVDSKIVFDLPVGGGTVIKEYTESTVVFNQTLNCYMGHMGIDFAADEGAEVLAVYGGTIASITTTYLEGTTIIIDHGGNLSSVYNSVEAVETLAEGQKVKKGDVIGYVANNNKQENKDGAHLHFEVLSGGETVNPASYLLASEK